MLFKFFFFLNLRWTIISLRPTFRKQEMLENVFPCIYPHVDMSGDLHSFLYLLISP